MRQKAWKSRAGAAALWACAVAAVAASSAPDPYAELKYRFIGPPGNRVSAVVGVPGDPNTYYVGAASGGVWKSTDGGIALEADLRRSAGPVDRRDRDRAFGSERRLGGDRASPSSAATSRSETGSTSRPTPARR